MKKVMLGLGLLFATMTGYSQGLENIIVEKYYVSDANEADTDGGILPVGSVTYRIFVDMKPGYTFQAAYGVPGHEMKIATSTYFFNNEDRGGKTANDIKKTYLKNNTVMLDSWLSVGAGSEGNFGILKSEDTGATTNADGLLQNNDASAGIPLTTADGLILGTPEAVTFVGLDAESAMFDSQNDVTNGQVFKSSNGSWASLNGAKGPTADNKVLIAQITTDGVFSFELNIQLGTPTKGTENYVAKDAVNSEIKFDGLTYKSTPVGITEAKKETKSTLFGIYPNPVKDAFSIEVTNESSANYSYVIYSEDGKLVRQQDLGILFNSQAATIDISALASGKYILGLSKNGTIAYKKIIKN